MISKRNNKSCEHELGNLERGRFYRCNKCMKIISYAKVILYNLIEDIVEPAALVIILDENHLWEICSDKYKILKDNSAKDLEIVKCKYCNLSGLRSNINQDIFSINYIEKLICTRKYDINYHD